MEGLRGGLLPEPLIDAVQQFLSFAVFVTQRIFRAGFHGASLPDEVSERKGGQRRFVNVLLQGVKEISCRQLLQSGVSPSRGEPGKL